jgi:hypothetical protein
MKFDRKLNNQIVTYYEHFLLRHDWAMRGIPFGVGDWYLLVGLGSSAVEYPLEFAAIYVDQQDDDDPKYIYVEVTEDTIIKLIVANSVSDLLPDLPERAIEAVNAASGGSTRKS